MNLNVKLNLIQLAGIFLPRSENANAVMKLPYMVKFLLVDYIYTSERFVFLPAFAVKLLTEWILLPLKKTFIFTNTTQKIRKKMYEKKVVAMKFI